MFRSLAQPFSFLFCFTLAVVILIPGFSQGQNNPGTPSFGAYDSHQYDSINLQNLNVMLNVPLMSKAGFMPFQLNLTGTQSNIVVQSGQIYPGFLNAPLSANVDDAILPAAGGQIAYYTSLSSTTCPAGDGSGAATKISGWVIELADGTQHLLPSTDASYSGSSCSGGFTDTTTDGSGVTLSVTGSTANSIYEANGFSITGSSVTDPNGNSVLYASGTGKFTDTLGVTALTQNSTTKWSWIDVNGGSPNVNLSTVSNSLMTAYGCTGLTDLPATVETFPTTINFPDTTSLALSYEVTPGYSPDVTGRISQLTMRDGVTTIQYNYNPSNALHDGLNCTYLTPTSISRHTSDGTTTYTLAYLPVSGTNYKVTDTVVDPGGNKTIYTFTGLTSTGLSPTYAQVLTQVQKYINGGTVSVPSYSSTPDRLEIHCYKGLSGQPGNCATAFVTLPITETDVYVQLPGMSNYSRTRTEFDSYGNVTDVAQFDFGAATPATEAQTVYGTVISYGGKNGVSCGAIGNNIYNRPCSVTTYANGNAIAQRLYAYDAHGNLLDSYVSPTDQTGVNGGVSYLGNTTSNVYNSNGTPSKTYDLANNETDYLYTGTYSDGTCSHPFPTKITNVSTGLSTSATWDCTGGVMLTGTDANGNVTTDGYKSSGGAADPWWRLMSVTDPLGNEVWKTYTATSMEASFTFNSGNSINNTIVNTDGYGRPLNRQRQQSPSSSNYDTVSASYSGFNSSGGGYVTNGTIPCSTTLGSPCSSGIASGTTDVLNRLTSSQDAGGGTEAATYAQNDVTTKLTPTPSGENPKQVENEYDGLGRVTSSCKISTTVLGNVSCVQNTGAHYGVFTTTSYTSSPGSQTVSSTRGVQTRSKTYDGLGRLLSNVTPEGGTSSYVYDTVPSVCNGASAAAPGKLISTTYANGNVNCYDYDALGRITAITGINGGGGGVCRRFYYDNSQGALGTIPSGITVSNPYGHMVEAETDTCVLPITSSSMITDEWFSYDKDRHVTDQWELTPNSGQYYHSTATFAGNGAVLTLKLDNISPAETSTYGLDGEGRWNSLSTYGQTVVPSNGVTFNAAGQPTVIDIGSASDNDQYTYDPNTGRMTNWQFTVGTKNESATLNWNANGTLNNLAITDGFNAGGTQTCYYNPSSGGGMGYDDLGRLLNVSCGTSGSIWNQTFGYDQYDNLTKSSSGPGITFNPGYNSSNNQYASGFGATYDAAGNITSDTYNSYAWDPFNKMQSVNINGTNCSTSGQCIVYDAFGHAVEIDSGGSSTEVWYTQLGKTVYMSGSTFKYAYWPTPGGSTLLQIPSYDYYYEHKDWLGNARISSNLTTAIIDDRAFAPYGEIYDNFGSTSAYENIFTGDTQDILATGNCCFDTPNRELSANQGRWLSPDPINAAWNRYAYPTNPNNFVDPSGLQECAPGCGGCTIDGCGSNAGGGGSPGGGNGYTYGGVGCDSGWGCDNINLLNGPVGFGYNVVWGTVPGAGLAPAAGGEGATTSIWIMNQGNLYYSIDGGNTWISKLTGAAYDNNWNLLYQILPFDPSTGLDTSDVSVGNDFINCPGGCATNSLNAAETSEARTILGLEGGATLGAVIVLAAPTIYSTGLGLAYDPEVVSNVVDFFEGFDPNPSGGIPATFGGFAGWVENDGAEDWTDCATGELCGPH